MPSMCSLTIECVLLPQNVFSYLYQSQGGSMQMPNIETPGGTQVMANVHYQQGGQQVSCMYACMTPGHSQIWIMRG